MQAFEDKYPIDILGANKEWERWLSASEPNWNWETGDYRVSKSPTLRPWIPREVPVGARYRAVGMIDYCATITGFTPSAVSSSCFNAGEKDNGEIKFAEMLAGYEHSTDHGKTWKPCGVLE